jgi:hypothetical protein
MRLAFCRSTLLRRGFPVRDAAHAAGRHPGFADVATAAIAKAHEL